MIDDKPLVFCCKVQPVEGEGHQTAAVLVAVRQMLKLGGVGGPYRYARPASIAPVSSFHAPITMVSVPTAVRPQLKWSLSAGVGLVKVLSNVPLVLNRYAAPA